MDDNKKPGARDISDLKARLGLKKQGAMPAASPAGTPAQGAPMQGAQGAVPAPTAPAAPAAPRAIPSPFGQPEPKPEPAPQPAAPPDPRRDPFAMQQAANLAAFYGVGQQLPGSADSVNAEISKPKPWGMIGLLAVVGAVVFGLGNACGRIYQSRAEFNLTIDQAGQIRDEVDRLSKQLNKIADVLNSSKLTAQGQPDFDMTKALGDLDLKKPDTQKIFHTNYMHFEDPAIERLFNYYDHTIQLYDQITMHVKKTEADKASIDNYAKTNGTGKANKNYAVVLDATGGLTLANFAELGSPVCPDPNQTDCPPGQLKGFKYRFDSGGAWGEKPTKGAPTSIVIPIKPSALFSTIAAGNPDVLAYKDYLRRVVTIKALAGNLVAEQKDVLGDLKKTAERPKVFVF